MTGLTLIPMRCRSCSWPFARTPDADRDCPFCGSDRTERPIAIALARRSRPAPAPRNGTPFEQAIARLEQAVRR